MATDCQCSNSRSVEQTSDIGDDVEMRRMGDDSGGALDGIVAEVGSACVVCVG